MPAPLFWNVVLISCVLYWCRFLSAIGLLTVSSCSDRFPSSLVDPSSPSSVAPSVPSDVFPVAPPHSLAILPFEDYTNRMDISWLSQGLPDMLTTDLGLIPGLRVVARHRLGEVLREQWLQQSGTFREQPSVRIGQLVGAQYLLQGLYYLKGEELVVEGHLLDVEQGVVIRTFREKGPVESLPDVEMKFAHQLSRLFTASGPKPEVKLKEADILHENRARPEVQELQMKEDDRRPSSHALTMSTPVLLDRDVLLMLERRRSLREVARSVAEEVWKIGVHFNMEPASERLRRERHRNRPGSSLFLEVPLSATILPQQWQRLSPPLVVINRDDVPAGSSVLLRFEGTDISAQKIFQETMRRPRRVFVRMVNKQGLTVAVSSPWSWRIDQQLMVQPDGAVVVPISSTPFLTGSAAFPGRWVVEQESAVRFEAVMVTVPRENRMVVVEEVAQGEVQTRTEVDGSSLGKALQLWLWRGWHPPVMESVPLPGYLPGNRRTATVLVFVVGDQVQRTQVTNMPPEPGLADSITALLAELQNVCLLPCPDRKQSDALSLEPVVYRVQFELFKDMQHVGLNQKS